MLRVDVFLGDSKDPFETFFVEDEKDIEFRMDGYRAMFGKDLEVSHKVSREDGNAEAHDLFGY